MWENHGKLFPNNEKDFNEYFVLEGSLSNGVV